MLLVLPAHKDSKAYKDCKVQSALLAQQVQQVLAYKALPVPRVLRALSARLVLLAALWVQLAQLVLRVTAVWLVLPVRKVLLAHKALPELLEPLARKAW